MKDIKGFEGLYAITKDGKVWSYSSNKFRVTYSTNYEYVNLYKYNKRHTMSIHRLVASAYIDNPSNLPEVDHIDNNPYNNDLSNLQWITRKDNLAKSYLTMSPVRNFKECKLYCADKLIGTFKSIAECCRFCVTLGLSYTGMNKYRKCGEYTINM